jgi:hypothetical protein
MRGASALNVVINTEFVHTGGSAGADYGCQILQGEHVTAASQWTSRKLLVPRGRPLGRHVRYGTIWHNAISYHVEIWFSLGQMSISHTSLWALVHKWRACGPSCTPRTSMH